MLGLEIAQSLLGTCAIKGQRGMLGIHWIFSTRNTRFCKYYMCIRKLHNRIGAPVLDSFTLHPFATLLLAFKVSVGSAGNTLNLKIIFPWCCMRIWMRCTDVAVKNRCTNSVALFAWTQGRSSLFAWTQTGRSDHEKTFKTIKTIRGNYWFHRRLSMLNREIQY